MKKFVLLALFIVGFNTSFAAIDPDLICESPEGGICHFKQSITYEGKELDFGYVLYVAGKGNHKDYVQAWFGRIGRDDGPAPRVQFDDVVGIVPGVHWSGTPNREDARKICNGELVGHHDFLKYLHPIKTRAEQCKFFVKFVG